MHWVLHMPPLDRWWECYTNEDNRIIKGHQVHNHCAVNLLVALAINITCTMVFVVCVNKDVFKQIKISEFSVF